MLGESSLHANQHRPASRPLAAEINSPKTGHGIPDIPRKSVIPLRFYRDRGKPSEILITPGSSCCKMMRRRIGVMRSDVEVHGRGGRREARGMKAGKGPRKGGPGRKERKMDTRGGRGLIEMKEPEPQEEGEGADRRRRGGHQGQCETQPGSSQTCPITPVRQWRKCLEQVGTMKLLKWKPGIQETIHLYHLKSFPLEHSTTPTSSDK
eukprot:1393730-Amorphochlora_amoeboformis.AAC.4